MDRARDQALQGRQFAPIRTGPIQVRIAIQDGHEVILTDDLGKVCNNCREPIQFSARDMAYVHSGSSAPVTRIMAMQTGPGLFDQDS
jgi:hypothetical protein